MAGIFVKALSAMYRAVKREPAPFIAKVGKDGSVIMWRPMDTTQGPQKVRLNYRRLPGEVSTTPMPRRSGRPVRTYRFTASWL